MQCISSFLFLFIYDMRINLCGFYNTFAGTTIIAIFAPT